MRSIVICIGANCVMAFNVQAQICSMSTPFANDEYANANFHRNNDDFLKIKGDLPFIQPNPTKSSDRTWPLAKLYVSARMLNIRNAPNGEIIGQTHRGMRVRIYAKRGNWLAITTPRPKSEWSGGTISWVHKSYVTKIKPAAYTYKELIKYCPIEDMAAHMIMENNNANCESINGYMKMTQLSYWLDRKGVKKYQKHLIKRLNQEPLNVIKNIKTYCFQLRKK